MKSLITFLSLLTLGSSAFAVMRPIARCSAPLLEGEYTVFLSEDKTRAKVSFSGIEVYPVTRMNRGPVSHYDFVSRFGTERIIIAVDGDNQLHKLDAVTGQFQKIATLTCRSL